jgi:hypothetical protein
LEGVVLAIETSEEAPTPDAVQRFLRSLAAMGDLYRIAALLVGRPGGAHLPVEDHPRYDDAVISVVRGDRELDRIPIAMGLDFGHTDPMWDPSARSPSAGRSGGPHDQIPRIRRRVMRPTGERDAKHEDGLL